MGQTWPSLIAAARQWGRGHWTHPLGVTAVSVAADVRNTACQSRTFRSIKNSQQWHARHVTHAPGRLLGPSRGSRTPSATHSTGCVYREPTATRGFRIKNFHRLSCCCRWEGEWPAMDSASWIWSKLQQDICSIDRNVIAWWQTKSMKKRPLYVGVCV